jgi:hypothetical protein
MERLDVYSIPSLLHVTNLEYALITIKMACEIVFKFSRRTFYDQGARVIVSESEICPLSEDDIYRYPAGKRQGQICA